jgi:RimJ/RimL family protein N-acetyltransferase
MMCFGHAAIAKVNNTLYDWCKGFVSKYTGFRCFDGIEMSFICNELAKFDYTVMCGQGSLPDMNFNRKKSSPTEDIRFFKKDEIKHFYENDIYGSFYPDNTKWHMCNFNDHIEYAAAHYKRNKVTGLVIACKQTESIYDIGYETLPEHREKGIATMLTTKMTDFLLDKGIIPFITFAWSNIASKNVAIKSGYVTAWSNMETCPKEFADKVFRGEAE